MRVQEMKRTGEFWNSLSYNGNYQPIVPPGASELHDPDSREALWNVFSKARNCEQ